MKKMLPLFLILSACVTDADEARKTLYKAGFTDVQIQGVAPFACSEDDLLGREFAARNAQGILVEGTVCCGLFKSCTIRF